MWPVIGHVGAGEAGAGHNVGGPSHLLALNLDSLVKINKYVHLCRKKIYNWQKIFVNGENI